MSRRLLVVAATLTLSSSLAFAGSSKAWNAAKKVHPDAPIIAGVDVASAKSSESFKKFYPLLLAQKKEVQEVLDKLKTACNFDPFTAVNSIVAVVDDSKDDKGAFYLAMNGWDATKLGNCAKKMAKNEKKTLTVSPVKKGIQEFSVKGETEKLYLGWIGKDVLVFATDPTDKTFVQSMLSGKPTGDANKMANKLDTAATLWMVVIKTQTVQPGMDMKAMYGTVKLNAGNLDADGRVVMGDAKQATNLVTMFNKELPNVQKMLPPAAKALVSSLKLTASGDEVNATASAPEKDVLALFSAVLGI